MSYSDDEELKIGDIDTEDELDLDAGLDDPLLDDDLLAIEEDDDDLEGFAGLDGSAEY